MQIDSNTPRADRLIGGIKVSVPQPYAEGYVVTAGEAQMLNQTLAENFSNNLRKRVTEFVEAEGAEPRIATSEEAQAIVDAYAGEYQPGVRRTGTGGGRQNLDPVEKEMRSIARESLTNLLKSQGIKRNEVNFDDLLEQVLTENADALRAKATKIVAARQKNSADDLDLGSILGNMGSGETAEAAAA